MRFLHSCTNVARRDRLEGIKLINESLFPFLFLLFDISCVKSCVLQSLINKPVNISSRGSVQEPALIWDLFSSFKWAGMEKEDQMTSVV